MSPQKKAETKISRKALKDITTETYNKYTENRIWYAYIDSKAYFEGDNKIL